MHNHVSNTMFYSFLFAMGGAPTIAMLLIQSQPHDPAMLYQIFIGLTVMIACILVPIILIQNSIIFIKRHRIGLADKLEPLAHFYLVINVLCLLYWVIYQIMN